MADTTQNFGVCSAPPVQPHTPLMMRINESQRDTILAINRISSLLDTFSQLIENVPCANGIDGELSVQPAITLTYLASVSEDNNMTLNRLADRL